jgi:hypothetical protein
VFRMGVIPAKVAERCGRWLDDAQDPRRSSLVSGRRTTEKRSSERLCFGPFPNTSTASPMPRINDFLADPQRNRFVVKVGNDAENLENLLDGRIDGFIADRIVAAKAAYPFSCSVAPRSRGCVGQG